MKRSENGTPYVKGLTVRTALCQCDGSSISVLGGTSFIRAPGHPEVRTAESCAWDFYLSSRPRILILNVADIQLYYAYGRTNGKNYVRCSGTLIMGAYDVRNNRRCSDKTSFCRVYYNDDACHATMSKMKDITSCADGGNPGNPLSIRFTSDGKSGFRYGKPYRNYARGFKMEYKYVNCLPETTTTTTLEPTTTSTNPTTGLQSTSSTSSKISTLVLKEISATTNATGVTAGGSQQNDTNLILPIVVVLGVLMLILFVAIGVLVYMKRKRSKTQASDQENEYQELDVGERNGTAHPHSMPYENLARVRTGPGLGNEPFYSNTGVIQSENYAGGINQSQTVEYSTINLSHQFNQSTSPNQAITQSENDEYAALNLGQQVVNQVDAGEYSMLNSEHSFRQSCYQEAGTSQSPASDATQPVYSTVNKARNIHQLNHVKDDTNQSVEAVYSTVNKASNEN